MMIVSCNLIKFCIVYILALATYFQLRLSGIPDCETWRVSCVHGEQLYTETNGIMMFRVLKAVCCS